MPALLAANCGGLTCQKALRRNDFWVPALYVLFFMSQGAVFGQVLECEHRHFPNFLSKNGHGNTCNEMHRLSIQKLLTFLYDLLAIVLTQHTNMRLI